MFDTCPTLVSEKRLWNVSRVKFGGDGLGDLLAVKAPVLNEDLVGVHARHDHACQVNSGALAFQRLRIAARLLRYRDRA